MNMFQAHDMLDVTDLVRLADGYVRNGAPPVKYTGPPCLQYSIAKLLCSYIR